MCPQRCVHNVSKVRAVRSLDLRRICSANVNSKSAGHGAGVSFPVQIQPGDAGQGWTGSSPQLGSYLLSVGAAAAALTLPKLLADVGPTQFRRDKKNYSRVKCRR